MRIKNFFAFPVLPICLLTSCATPKARPRVQPQTIAQAQSAGGAPQPAQRLWSRKMPGLVSDLSISRDGRFLLVATIPNREVVPTGDSEPDLLRLNEQGKTLWRKRLAAQVKAQDLSADGSLAVIDTYQEKLIAFNAAGKQLWSQDGVCKPYILSKSGSVVCYHDDDAEPGVAFDVFSSKTGEKTFSFPIQSDIVAFRISQDERNIALGLTGGQVILLGPDFKIVWQKTVPGEIADLSVSSGESPRVAVISKRSKAPQETVETDTVLDASSGQPLYQKEEPAPNAQEVEISPDGKTFWLFFGSRENLRLITKKLESDPAHESQVVVQVHTIDLPEIFEMARDTVMTSLSGKKGSDDIMRLVGYDSDGHGWEAALEPEENLYLSVYAIGRSGRVVAAAAMDDGSLSVFRITPQQ